MPRVARPPAGALTFGAGTKLCIRCQSEGLESNSLGPRSGSPSLVAGRYRRFRQIASPLRGGGSFEKRLSHRLAQPDCTTGNVARDVLRRTVRHSPSTCRLLASNGTRYYAVGRRRGGCRQQRGVTPRWHRGGLAAGLFPAGLQSWPDRRKGQAAWRGRTSFSIWLPRASSAHAKSYFACKFSHIWADVPK